MMVVAKPRITPFEFPERKLAALAAPLHAPVYEILRDLILSGKVRPGTKLKEEEVAGRLSVSRTPLREALARLAKDKLVRIFPHRGAYVADFTKDEIIEILTVREALEGLTARLAAERITDATIRRLKSIMYPPRLAELEARVPAEIARLDQRFHETLYRATGNSRLIEIMGQLNDQMQLVRIKTMVLPHRLDQSLKETHGIIEAIGRRDPGLAESRAKAHIRNARAAVIAYYRDAR